MNYVGLDITLNSPGVTVIQSDGKVKCYFWQQRVRESNFHHAGEQIEIIALPFDKKVSRRQKALQIGRGIRKVLADLPRESTRIAIEFYSLDSETSCLTQLAEISGAVCFTVVDMGFEDPIDVPPKTLKKIYAGKGNALKSDMLQTWLTEGLPDLISLFSVKRARDNPVEDIVDSYALARKYNVLKQTVEKLAKQKAERKAKKRKLPDIL